MHPCGCRLLVTVSLTGGVKWELVLQDTQQSGAQIVTSGLCLCLPAWLPVCPQLMAVGIPVSFLAGAGICWGHLMYAWKTALKFKVLPDGVKPRTIHRFWSEFDVEVASRIGRVWDEEGVLDQTALEIAENVIKVCQQRSRHRRSCRQQLLPSL